MMFFETYPPKKAQKACKDVLASQQELHVIGLKLSILLNRICFATLVQITSPSSLT